jgi:hypothetical protein
MLFLLMKPGFLFTPHLVDRVKAAIRSELSARHVPMWVFETPEIPVCKIPRLDSMELTQRNLIRRR